MSWLYLIYWEADYYSWAFDITYVEVCFTACLDKLFAVELHLVDIDVSPEGGVPVAKAALDQVYGAPQRLQHHDLSKHDNFCNSQTSAWNFTTVPHFDGVVGFEG